MIYLGATRIIVLVVDKAILENKKIKCKKQIPLQSLNIALKLYID
jgi:hypothetical protein